jgi:hypothetical protein
MHISQGNMGLLSTYGRRAPAGDPIPQFRYDAATDRMVPTGTTVEMANSWPGATNPLPSILPQPSAGGTTGVTTAVRPAGLGIAGVAYGVLATASMAASAYHGVRRNDSVGWGIWWGLMGSMFPIITPAIALAQGFAKPARR